MDYENKFRQELADIAKQYFEDAPPSHDWYHVERCYRLAEDIGRKEEADMDVLLAATLLHDIGRSREDDGAVKDHSNWAADRAGEILQDLGKGREFIERVEHCIDSHRYSREPEPETLEAEILSDVDTLDSMGFIGIARTFSYDGETGIPLIVPHDLEDEYTGLAHLEGRVMDMKNRINTESALEIAERRESRVKRFIQELKKEVTLGLDG